MLPSAALTAGPNPTPNEILLLIQKIQSDATQAVLAAHGQGDLDFLKKEMAKKYPPDKYPPPANAYSCPGFASSEKQTGLIVNAKITDQAGAYFIVGAEAVLKGEPDVAKWAFATAASFAPMCSVHLANLAFILNLEKDFGTALILLNFARSLDPSNGSIYINMAYSYTNLEKYDEAIQAYLVAIALNPTIQKYQEMMMAVQKLKEKEKAAAISGQGGQKGAKGTGLNQALKLLENQKKKEMDQSFSSSLKQSFPASSGKKLGPGTPYRHMPASGRTASEFPSPLQGFAPGLRNAIDMFEAGAQRAKQDAGQFALGSTPHVIREVAATANLMMADLLKGYLKEITGEWYEGSTSEWFARKGREDLEKLKKIDRPPKSGIKHKFYLGPITFEEDFDGSFKLGVSAGFLGGEWKYNPKTYNFGFKASFGPQYQFGLGPIGATVKGEAYFEVDLDKGPVAGLTAKNVVGLTWAKVPGKGGKAPEKGGQGTSIIPTQLEGEYKLIKVSFENTSQ